MATAVKLAEELRTLREALAVTKLREEAITERLKRFMADERHDVIRAEGIPPLRNVEGSSWNFDLKQMAADDPKLLLRLAEYACLKLLKGDADKLAAKGLVQGYLRFGWQGSTHSLRFED